MLPQNQASALAVASALLPPDNTVSSPIEDFELGGVAVQDTTQGLQSYVWRCWLDDINVRLQRTGAAATTLFSASNVTALSLAFDQNMRPAVAYMLNDGVLRLRWYDTVIEAYVTSTFGTGRNPRLTLDDKRIEQAANSDIIFAYIRDTNLCYRQQRDRYTVERVLKNDVPDTTKLKNIGMGTNLRLHFELV